MHASSKTPIISVGCIYRNAHVGAEINFDWLINGGVAPYALIINWGDGTDNLISVSTNSRQTIQHTYTTSGIKEVTLKTTDSNGTTAQIQTVISVDGEPVATASPIDTVVQNIQSVWIEAPVPLYVAAVMLVLGFWIGDVFERLTLARAGAKSRTKQRHA